MDIEHCILFKQALLESQFLAARAQAAWSWRPFVLRTDQEEEGINHENRVARH